MSKITILNTSILTSYGQYSYTPTSVEEIKPIINVLGFESAVGHQSTCEIITQLLGIEVPMNRILYSQGIGESALVFKLNGRPEEGKILTAEEIETMGYSFGWLERTA